MDGSRSPSVKTNAFPGVGCNQADQRHVLLPGFLQRWAGRAGAHNTKMRIKEVRKLRAQQTSQQISTSHKLCSFKSVPCMNRRGAHGSSVSRRRRLKNRRELSLQNAGTVEFIISQVRAPPDMHEETLVVRRYMKHTGIVNFFECKKRRATKCSTHS